MGNDLRTIGGQVISGVFITIWLLARPFVWLYIFAKAVFNDAGKRIVRFFGAIIAVAFITEFIIFISSN